MAEKVGGIEYEVGMDLNGLRKGSKKLGGAFGDIEKKAKQTDLTMQRLSRTAIAVFSGIAVARVKKYSDSYTNLQNQLRQVTKDSENLAGATLAVFDVANKTRSSVEATAGLYSKLARSTQELGLSQQDVLDITETINKTFAVSGATAQEASNAITQLSQGLASGALRGDEFNSVAEQAPGILRAVSMETGLSVGQLREFAAEGKITTDLLVRSLRKYSTTADTEFKKAKVSIEQSTTVLNNNFTRFIGVLDDATGGASIASDAILSLSSTIVSITNLVGSGVISDAFSMQLSFISEDIERTTQIIEDEFTDLFNFVGDNSPKMTGFLSDAFYNFIPNVKAVVKIAVVEIASFVDKVAMYSAAMFDFLNPFSDKSTAQIKKDLAERGAVLDSVRNDMLSQIITESEADKKTTDRFIKGSQSRVEQYEKEQKAKMEALTGIINEPSSDGEDGGDPVQSATTGIQAFKDELGSLVEEAKNVETALGKAFGGNVLSAVDNLSGGIADAVVNQESLGDAVKETAKAFLRDMIASLVKVAAQKAINFAIEQTMGAASTTASATQAGILATAWAPAAALTSLAMAGTNSVPAMAGIASTVGLSESLAVAGARFNGGSVQAGGLYKVNENNKSEGVMFGHGNEQYLMPNKNGKVTSNRDMNSGGGSIQVTVNNYGEPMEVRTQQNGNVVTIDMLPNLTTSIMQNDFANRGKARKTLESTSNLTNRTS